MKLQEAAKILGLSLEEVTPDILKSSFKKLTMSWDADKCKDASSKQRYIQITEAYKKLNSVMEGKNTLRGDDSHEIAAFMRMFMDMVGISENDPLPAAAMTFGMMFGAQPNGMDEWSTDDDADYDEDEEDGDYAEDYEDYPQLTNSQKPSSSQKNNAGSSKAATQTQSSGLSEEEKRQKIAKKRADKRKKQKERKLKETVVTMDEVMTGKVKDDSKAGSELAPLHSNRNIFAQKHNLKSEFFTFIQLGEVTTTEMAISTRFLKGFSLEVKEDVALEFRNELPTLYPVHKCITSFTEDALRKTEDVSQLNILASNRLLIAKQLLSMTDPVIDINLYDEQGLSVLHRSILLRDNNFVAHIIEVITNTNADRKTNLNVNSRCHKKGWAPLHYAIESLNIDAMTMLSLAGANLAATSATDKKLTPMELARQKLKGSQQNLQKEQIQQVLTHLQTLINAQKSSGKKAEVSQEVGKEEKKNIRSDEAANSASKAQEKKGSGKKKQESKKKAGSQGKESNQLDTSVIETHTASVEVKIGSGTHGASSSAKSIPSPPSQSSSSSTNKGVNSLQEMSLASRDELVDRLSAMGFAEPDCLQAISFYGTDIDQAISWLCERPLIAAISAPIVSEAVKKDPSPQISKGYKGTKPELKPVLKTAPVIEPPKPALDQEAALRLKKEREELRRINRAWNAKAEDEKRRLKQQAEEERLRDLAMKAQTVPTAAGSAPSPSFSAPAESNPSAFYSLVNNKAVQPEAVGGSVPIAPGLHWPTVAQAAALNVKEGSTIPSSPTATSGSTGPTTSKINSSPKLSSSTFSSMTPDMKQYDGSRASSSPRNTAMPSLDQSNVTSTPQPTGQAIPVSNDMMYANQAYVATMGFVPAVMVPAGYTAVMPGMAYAAYPAGYDPAYMAALQQQQQQQAYMDMINQSLAGMAHDSSSQPMEDSDMDMYRNGAVELSAGAKPFVPKTFIPSSPAAPSMAPLVGTDSSSAFATSSSVFPSAVGVGMSPSINNMWGVNSVGVSPLSSSLLPPSSTSLGMSSGLGMSAFSSLPPISSSLPSAAAPVSSLFGLSMPELGIHDQFDFDVPADIIPDLDSLLDHGDLS